MAKFYDTSALLDLQQNIFKEDEKFIISDITLIELEQIKTSGSRDEEIKWQARQLLHALAENESKYEIYIYNTSFEDCINENNLIVNNDSKIIATAYNWSLLEDITFITSDLSCLTLAKLVGLEVELTHSEDNDEYSGFIVNQYNDEELANFYTNTLQYNNNIYFLKENQYLLLENNGTIVDKYKWAGGAYKKIPFYKTESKLFGKTYPKDDYQQLALDSLHSNQITMLRGNAGTGKSYLAFGYMFQLLEQGKIDKIIIFCNTVATKGSAKLGFYPGSRTEKLLDSQIGNLLESKIGDKFIVEKLIDEGKIILLPMADIRGYDTTNMNAAVYISEAQNLDIELMRLALQRIGEDSICIIDGDFNHQLDLSMYAGNKNGMRRVSKVFRGQTFYGEVELQKIHRSKIAEIAELL